MTIHHRKFGFFHCLSVISTNKPVNRSKHAYPLTQLNVFALRGFFFHAIHKKNKEGVWAHRAIKYKKYVAGKCTRTRAPLARKYTNRNSNIRVTRWHNKYKILNCIERHNFCLSDFLTNSNRTTLQSHKVEERTFWDTLYLPANHWHLSP